MAKHIKGFVIPLCIEGVMLSSQQFASRISDISVSGVSVISFVIGGSFGLSDEIKAKASLKLSISPMTFTHGLARVILLEQVYRAFNILSNGRYHK